MTFWQSVRYAIRGLRRSRAFTCVAVFTLAVGIGSTTAMFSVFDGVLLKPLHYPQAGRIVAVLNRYADRSTPALTGGDEIDISGERGAFDAFAYYHGGQIGVQFAGRAEFVGVRLVHPEFFRVFGVAPLAGRLFNEEDAQQSAIVSAGFAARNFGSAEAALGRRLFIENRSYEIVGVMSPEMQFPQGTDAWAADSLLPGNRNRSGHNYRAVARLVDGVSVASANARLSALAERLAASFPDSNRGKTFLAVPLADTLAAPARTTLYVLMGAVALVLLIACANVTNLMLARATGRSREIAVRVALGATRRQVVGQLLAESIVLAFTAGVVGIAVAYAGTHALLQYGSRFVPLPRLNDVHMDGRALLFSIAVSAAAAIGFGLVPAFQAAGLNVTGALGQGGSRGTVGGGSVRLRAALVVVQIALSYVLAVDAGLLLRSFVALTDVNLGFRTEQVLVMYAHAPARGSFFDKSGTEDYVRVGRTLDELLVRLRRLPGIIAAGAAMGLPTGQYDSNGAYAVEGRQTFSGDFRRLPAAGFRLASPGYFATLGVPIVRGRDFNEGDLYDRPFVAIVSQSLARQSFGEEDPIGHKVMCGLDQPDKWMTIVGVVGDVRQASPASRPGPELYMPLRQHPYLANEQQVVVRTALPPEAAISAVQQTVRALNPEIATRYTTLETSVSDSIAAPRFRMTLVSAFAGVALLLAIAGMYAVMSYVTAQRTSEFGVRMALGATGTSLIGLVLRRAGGLVLMGMTGGVALALATSRILAAMLFGLATTDVMTYAGALLAATPLVILAAAVPAFKASRVDPLAALRDE